MKKIISLILAAAMFVAMFSVPVFAETEKEKDVTFLSRMTEPQHGNQYYYSEANVADQTIRIVESQREHIRYFSGRILEILLTSHNYNEDMTEKYQQILSSLPNGSSSGPQIGAAAVWWNEEYNSYNVRIVEKIEDDNLIFSWVNDQTGKFEIIKIKKGEENTAYNDNHWVFKGYVRLFDENEVPQLINMSKQHEYDVIKHQTDFSYMPGKYFVKKQTTNIYMMPFQNLDNMKAGEKGVTNVLYIDKTIHNWGRISGRYSQLSGARSGFFKDFWINLNDCEFLDSYEPKYFGQNYKEPCFGDSRSLGDTNKDFMLQINDATIIQMYLAHYSGIRDDIKTYGDFDNNGKININDVTNIQRYLAGMNVDVTVKSTLIPENNNGEYVEEFTVKKNGKTNIISWDNDERVADYVVYKFEKIGREEVATQVAVIDQRSIPRYELLDPETLQYTGFPAKMEFRDVSVEYGTEPSNYLIKGRIWSEPQINTPFSNADDDLVLIKTENEDPNYIRGSFDYVTQMNMSNQLMNSIEELVRGEAGDDYVQCVLMAQCIRDTMLVHSPQTTPLDNLFLFVVQHIEKDGTGHPYRTEKNTTGDPDAAYEAVRFVFKRGGCAVKHYLHIKAEQGDSLYDDARDGITLVYEKQISETKSLKYYCKQELVDKVPDAIVNWATHPFPAEYLRL